MTTNNHKDKLAFKRYPRLGQLIGKVTKNDFPDNISFDYYNKFHVDIQSGTNDYMAITIRDINSYTTIAEINFDYLTMDVDINYAQTNDIAMDIMYSFKKAYPYDINRLKFNINKTDDIFTDEDYQEITLKGFKCNLIKL